MSKVSDTLAQFEGQFIVPTQTDLMTVGKIPGWEREAYGGTRFPDIGKGHGWAADSKAAASKLRNSAVAGKKYGEKSLVVPISTSKYGALSNSTVANEIARRIRQGQLKPEDIQGIEHYLKRKAPTEGNSLEQFLDPDFLRNATFNQRRAFGEAVGSYGSNKKGSKANPRAAAGHSLPDIERLLEESMDPHWKGLDNPLLHGGNRLISLEDYVDESGDFHPDYHQAIRGKKEADLSQAVPGNLLFRDQSDQVKKAHAAGQTNKKDLDFYHFMGGLPLRQQITDDYLRNLQSHGYAEGGRVARGLTPEQHAVLGGKHKDHPVYSKPFGEGKHGVYHGSRDLQRQAKADWAAHEAEVAAKPRYGMVAGKMQQLEKLANGGTITDKAKRYAESIGKSYDPSLGMSADTGEDKQGWIGRAHKHLTERQKRPGHKKDRGLQSIQDKIFNAWAKKHPEVVESLGAKSYKDLVRNSYKDLTKETNAQYDALGVPTRKWGDQPGDFEKYDYLQRAQGTGIAPAQLLKNELNEGKQFDVYGDQSNPHPALGDVDPKTGWNTNEKFRAIHDAFGHAAPDQPNSFGPKGEENAFLSHSQMFSPGSLPAASAELRGQNSYVNYVNNRNKKLRKQGKPTTEFANNLPTVLPPEASDMSYRAGVPEYLKGQLYKKGGEVKKRPKYYHGSSKIQQLIDILEGGSFNRPLHVTPDVNIARHYAGPKGQVAELEFPFEPRANMGQINRGSNFNATTGAGTELIIDPQEMNRILKTGDYGHSIV